MLTTSELLRREWTGFRRPGRLIAMVAAALAVVTIGLLYAFGNHASCDGSCPAEPTGPDGSLVNDQFAFLHRDLGENGSITVRMTSMTGTITYPPPDHDQIVPGLVPWAKAGIIIKDGVRQGSSYAALMLTGDHGVRMQYDYRHDIAGSDGGVSATSPRWLRLTRAGDTITGYESADGERWAKVGTARLSGLPRTVRVGLFATSPGDLTLRPVGLGGATEEVRFTQAGATFDNVVLKGAPSGGRWSGDAVGEMNRTDWEKYHKASGAVEEGGTISVTGTGDIGPGDAEGGGRPVERTLGGLALGLLVVLVVAVRFVTSEYRREAAYGPPVTRRTLAAKAVVAGAVTFLTGLLAVGITIPVGVAIVRGNGIPVIGVSVFTGVRVVVGTAAVFALTAVLAVALGALLRRAWLAILAGVLAIAVPYVVTSFPLLADGLSQWLLRVTPAAGFAAQQTLIAYPQVVAHYVPSTGYFPLPWWAGIAVLCAYAVMLLGLALNRLPHSDERAGQPVGWR
ncbi:ABC transporter permease subunit [Streptomyces sp. L-9-10]|uniref:ABC transporter permease subunit n=1 Tax=Streptomyces sp. L-9-10 TaxID=1478131 RepID=UPI00101CA988|nr:ABC transporter permease subunit [Streptomyces sp. L-9-10]